MNISSDLILPLVFLGLSESLTSFALMGELYKPRWSTLVLIALPITIVTTWWINISDLSNIFTPIKINSWQQLLDIWLQAPSLDHGYFWLPTLVSLVTVLMIMKVSPQPCRWSRFAVVGILALLTTRYFLWRSASTLNLADPINGCLSLGLFGLEMLMLFNGMLQLLLLTFLPSKQPETSSHKVSNDHQEYLPSVDIFIPTYNESTSILKRTIIGCQAIDYPGKKIYLLDDNQREAMRQLAMELGCQYITRNDNLHAKAGNINNALKQTSGELIAVFDADFIPTKNFLQRTIHFFQDQQVGLVQTPQNFYNVDPIARNLGLENQITTEEELFYRHIQPIRHAAGSLVCCGTSFVIRRKALLSVGGFCTDSITEDYYTGVRLCAQGYRLVYVNEKLSAGLAAENITGYITQRLRWCRGSLQGLFIDANPLVIPGLSFIQRLAHLEGFLHWFSCFTRIGFLLMPLAYFWGAIPLKASTAELLYFLLPYYLTNLAIFTWLNLRSRSFFLSDLYGVILCFPMALTAIQTIINPFSKGFKVTPKGIKNDNFVFNQPLALPLLAVGIATAISLLWSVSKSLIIYWWYSPTLATHPGINLGWIWSVYNLLIIGIALLILVDAPQIDSEPWFDLRRVIKIKIDGQTFWGTTTMISANGMEVEINYILPRSYDENTSVNLSFMNEKLCLLGQLVTINNQGESTTMGIKFCLPDLNTQGCLIEMLFCRPGQWKSFQNPTEIKTVLLLLKSLIKPRFLFESALKVSFLEVSQLDVLPPAQTSEPVLDNPQKVLHLA